MVLWTPIGLYVSFIIRYHYVTRPPFPYSSKSGTLPKTGSPNAVLFISILDGIIRFHQESDNTETIIPARCYGNIHCRSGFYDLGTLATLATDVVHLHNAAYL